MIESVATSRQADVNISIFVIFWTTRNLNFKENIKEHHSDGNYMFWPEQASAHYSNIAVDYFERKNINCIKKLENPANVP
jgi:hypothetical protein